MVYEILLGKVSVHLNITKTYSYSHFVLLIVWGIEIWLLDIDVVKVI